MGRRAKNEVAERDARFQTDVVKTLSVSEGRKRLGHWLKKAVQGEDIAFAFEGKVVALRPVEIYSEDYALREYGVTRGQLDQFVRKAKAELAQDRKQRRLKPFTGRLGSASRAPSNADDCTENRASIRLKSM